MAEAIDYFSKRHPLRWLATKVAYGARKKMFALFMDALQPSAQDTVLDVGVTPDTSLPDSNFFEKLYPYTDKLTATSIEDASNLTEEFPGLSFVQTKKSVLPFKDKEFDIVFCSAVLEHVGSNADQRAFVKELLRVSKRFFMTTPNKGFPIEVHTFLPLIHWLPQRLHQRLLRVVGLSFWADINNLNLLSDQSLIGLFPDGESHLAKGNLVIKKNRTLGMASNLIIYGDSVS